MLSFIGFPEYLYGGIPKVSYVSNAHRHLNKDNLLILDITNFFSQALKILMYMIFFQKYT